MNPPVAAGATWSRGRLQSLAACPGCGATLPAEGSASAQRYTRRDDDARMPDLWTMHACPACASLYLDPRPDPHSLGRAYDGYGTHAGTGPADPAGVTGIAGGTGLRWNLVRGYLNHRFGSALQPASAAGAWLFRALPPLALKLDYFGAHLTRQRCPVPGRVLDVGCGNGERLLRLQALGWQGVGCEPFAPAVAACRARGLDVRQGDLLGVDLPLASFDAILFSHVIEHLEQPERTLQRACALLRPGGLLWIATPNPQSLGRHLFGMAWKGLHMPFHLCIPSQPLLRQWVQAAGFTRVQLLRRGLQGPSFRWSAALARREGRRWPPAALVPALTLLDGLLGTLSVRWGEETVLLARRPGGDAP